MKTNNSNKQFSSSRDELFGKVQSELDPSFNEKEFKTVLEKLSEKFEENLLEEKVINDLKDYIKKSDKEIDQIIAKKIEEKLLSSFGKGKNKITKTNKISINTENTGETEEGSEEEPEENYEEQKPEIGQNNLQTKDQESSETETGANLWNKNKNLEENDEQEADGNEELEEGDEKNETEEENLNTKEQAPKKITKKIPKTILTWAASSMIFGSLITGDGEKEPINSPTKKPTIDLQEAPDPNSQRNTTNKLVPS